jgi:hypothetical protein
MAVIRSGLQARASLNLFLACVPTFPVRTFIGAVLFASDFYVAFNNLGTW